MNPAKLSNRRSSSSCRHEIRQRNQLQYQHGSSHLFNLSDELEQTLPVCFYLPDLFSIFSDFSHVQIATFLWRLKGRIDKQMWKQKRRTNLNKQTTVKNDKQQAATESIQNRARKDKQPDFAQWQQILNHHKREITKEQWFRPVCTDLPYSQCFTKEAAKQMQNSWCRHLWSHINSIRYQLLRITWFFINITANECNHLTVWTYCSCLLKAVIH